MTNERFVPAVDFVRHNMRLTIVITIHCIKSYMANERFVLTVDLSIRTTYCRVFFFFC